MTTLDELYTIIDSFLVEAKDQYGTERSVERLNQDRHLAFKRIMDLIHRRETEAVEATLKEVEDSTREYHEIYPKMTYEEFLGTIWGVRARAALTEPEKK